MQPALIPHGEVHERSMDIVGERTDLSERMKRKTLGENGEVLPPLRQLLFVGECLRSCSSRPDPQPRKGPEFPAIFSVDDYLPHQINSSTFIKVIAIDGVI